MLIALAGFCLVKPRPDVAAGIVGGDIFLYVLILPLDCRGDFHRGRKRVGNGRMASDLAAIYAGTVVGEDVGGAVNQPGPGPAAAGGRVLARGSVVQSARRESTPFAPALAILCWVVGQLVVTSVAIYAASFAKNTLQGILAAFVILATGGGVIWLAISTAHYVALAPVQWLGVPRVDVRLILPVLSVALVMVLCLFQGFAWYNFPRCGLRVTRLIGQFAVLFVALWLIAWFFFSALIFLNGGF